MMLRKKTKWTESFWWRELCRSHAYIFDFQLDFLLLEHVFNFDFFFFYFGEDFLSFYITYQTYVSKIFLIINDSRPKKIVYFAKFKMVLFAQCVPLSFLLEWTKFWEEEYFVKLICQNQAWWNSNLHVMITYFT